MPFRRTAGYGCHRALPESLSCRYGTASCRADPRGGTVSFKALGRSSPGRSGNSSCAFQPISTIRDRLPSCSCPCAEPALSLSLSLSLSSLCLAHAGWVLMAALAEFTIHVSCTLSTVVLVDIINYCWDSLACVAWPLALTNLLERTRRRPQPPNRSYHHVCSSRHRHLSWYLMAAALSQPI